MFCSMVQVTCYNEQTKLTIHKALHRKSSQQVLPLAYSILVMGVSTEFNMLNQFKKAEINDLVLKTSFIYRV